MNSDQVDMSGTRTFKYKELDLSVDCIRLLVLLPDIGDDHLACELIHTTFASKPEYEALSYTWGEADNLKCIHLHDSPFDIRQNLYNALFNLRSKTEKRLIWADAICIDQNNVQERSSQVRLMAFIYSRAQAVVIWLGIQIPIFYDESRTQFKSEYVELLCSHPYWRRVWIIQEVSLARNLIFGFNGATFGWSELEIPFRRIKDLRQSLAILYDPVERVLEQRKNRHDDKNRLELLIEKFLKAQCGEIRDKIYGFIGLAHDCYDESIRVDYSSSLYDIFTDVVKFQHAAKALEGPFYHPWQEPPDCDRPARLVRFAQLVQQSFDGTVNTTTSSRMIQEDLFHAKGYIAGTILHVGTSYDEYIASFAAERQWKLSWNEHYTDFTDLTTLRQMDAAYTVKLLEMGDIDLAKIQHIRTETSFGFKGNVAKFRIGSSGPIRNVKAFKPQYPASPSEANSSNGPRRFLGSLLAFGLVPPAAREGDLICRFWDCNVAIVIRQQDTYEGFYSIIGRADVAERPTEDKKDKTIIERAISDTKNYSSSNYSYEPIEFYLDIETLQKMTS